MRLFSSCSKRFFAHRRRFADGRGLLAALRANPSTALIPVIFLSAEAGPEARVDALLHGVDDFLVKVAHSLVKALHADGRLVSPFNLASSSPGSTFICSSARCAANWNGEVRDLPLAQGLRLLTRPFVRSGRADTSTDRERDALPRPRRSLQHALRPISRRHLHDGCRGPDELCVLSLLHPRAITADLSHPDANPKFYDISGHPTNKPLSEWRDSVLPEDLPRAEEIWVSAIRTGEGGKPQAQHMEFRWRQG